MFRPLVPHLLTKVPWKPNNYYYLSRSRKKANSLLPMSSFSSSSHIPVDYTISKTLIGGDLTVHDSAGNLAFRLRSSPGRARTLLDSSGTPLISILNNEHGKWQGFRENAFKFQNLIFTVRRTSSSIFSSELEVFPIGDNIGSSGCSFKLRGNPFQRSCTVYQGSNILAQANLKYKLQKSFPSRRKFRLTIYPEVDQALVLSLVGIFFW